MVRLIIGYLGLSIVGPILFLFAITQNSMVTAYMTPPLALVTLAFLMLLIDVARRDGRLSRPSFIKAAAGLGIACTLIVAACTQLVVSYLPHINLGASASSFDMMGFAWSSVLPLLAYSCVLGFSLWHISVNGNLYLISSNASDHSKLIPLKKAPRPESIAAEEKKVANLD